MPQAIGVIESTGARILLVGQPNVGKSVIFNRLTGGSAAVSNYPGTTVDLEEGIAVIGGIAREVVDAPGTASLLAGSDDERVTEGLVLDSRGATVVQVGDSKSLRRTLFLSTQLIELEIPLVLVLNMMDECRERGEVPDTAALEKALGCPVVPAAAVRGEGIDELRRRIPEARRGSFRIAYPRPIEEALERAAPILAGLPGPRGLGLLYLAADRETEARLEERLGPEDLAGLSTIRAGAARASPIPLSLAIHQARFDAVGVQAAAATVRGPRPEEGRPAGPVHALLVLPLLGLVAGWIATWLLHGFGLRIPGAGLWPVHAGGAVGAILFARRGLDHSRRRLTPRESLGELWVFPATALPLFALTLSAAYMVVGVFAAGDCVDFIENKIFGNTRGYELAPDGSRTVGFDLGFYIPLSKHFTADGEPIGPTLVHIPWKGINHYLSEAASGLLGGEGHPVHELFFHEEMGLVRVGLTYSIAIVLPIVAAFFLVFGLLEDSGLLPRIAVLSDRILKWIGMNGKAVLPLVLGTGCATMATLTTRILESRKERTIAILLLALAVPCSAQLGIITGVMARISPVGMAVFALFLAGQLLFVGFLASKVIPGRRADFVVEVPPLRVPLAGNVLAKTGARVRWFLVEAVPLFLLGTFILFVATKLGAVGLLTKAGEPVVTGVLGLPADTTVGFLLGFLRRDFAAVRILDGFLQGGGTIDVKGVLVAVVVITLFVPCLANFLVMVREKGLRTASLMAAFIFPYAVLVGGVLRLVLSYVPASWLEGR